MSTENDNSLERDATDSDDGFEVVDPEPEEEPEDFKGLSSHHFSSAENHPGTIMFCHMDDKYDSIQQIKCQYYRPEKWTEQKEDNIALFEVGWMNICDAVARIPVDLTVPEGYPLGSVNLSGFSFPAENFVEVSGDESQFQFCYIRKGYLLGASTPFIIRGIGRLPLTADKAVFVPNGQIAAVPLFETANNFSVIGTTAAVDIPPFTHSQDDPLSINEASHAMSDGADLDEICVTIWRNMAELIGSFSDHLEHENNRTELRQSPEELTGEMQNATRDLPPSSTFPSLPASCEDLEQRYKTHVAQHKEIKDEFKGGMKNRTPPSSLSDLGGSDFITEAERKMQQKSEELKKGMQKAGDVLIQETEQLLLKTTDHVLSKKQLEDAEIKLKTVKEELTLKEETINKLQKQLEDTGAAFNAAKEELSLKESDLQDLKRKFEESESELKAVKQELALKEINNRELKSQIQDASEKMSLKEKEMESQLNDTGKELEELMEELSLKEANHLHYVAEVEKEKKQTEVRIGVLAEESAVLKSKIKILLDEAEGNLSRRVLEADLKSQIQSLSGEVELNKSNLRHTITELANARREVDSLKEQCTELVRKLNFMDDEKSRLLDRVTDLKEELEKKEQSDSSAEAQHDILVQEFMKKSEELIVEKQKVENFQEELSHLNTQRTSLQKEMLKARQESEQAVDSVVKALEQSDQEKKQLEKELETEKKRARALEEKLQMAAGKNRTLYMEKITLESRIKEILGSD